MTLHPLAFQSPVRLEYFSGWVAAGIFVALAVPIVLLGMRSLNGLGPVRKWVAIGARLLVVACFILILGGIRWQRQHKELQIMVLRDVSESTRQVRDFPGKTLEQSFDEYLLDLTRDENKTGKDTIGLIRFQETATIDALPGPTIRLDARAVARKGTGTDAASAIQLALATMSKDAMHRLLLIWDGNQTAGDIDAAIASAASQGVQIDVMPLRYDVQNEVLLERFVAPQWKRENEPFTIDVVLRSTNVLPTSGFLTVYHQGEPMDMDPATAQVEPRRKVTLKNGLNVERVRIPALGSAGVHQFRAVFDGDSGVTVEGQPGGGAPATNALAGMKAGDTNADNNAATAFTFVRGKGQVLYVDNALDNAGVRGPGDTLVNALKQEGITLKTVNRDQIPSSLVELQGFDAVILANVPCGAGGISDQQDKMFASYVHEMGGGLVVIGGPDTLGAGGWQGRELEKVLPVDMDIPAQRQVGKGALVLIMHSCEMPDGNYWGEQCAIKAIETLSEKDEIGVISYGWNNGRSGWDFPLAEKGDGSKVLAAVKQMKLGDMPSFDDSMNVALNGLNGQPGLLQCNARHKHVIIISDGDPQQPNPNLVAQYQGIKGLSVSTVTVYPHMGGGPANKLLPPTMEQIAKDLRGKAYGPINNNPNQLPQIFIKEATIVRRSLIHEEPAGIPTQVLDASDDIIKGFDRFPPQLGMVLTSRKNDPKVELPLTAGKNNDPVLAHWQAGLGKSAVFAGDAHNKWGPEWVGWAGYAKFWAQVVRKVSRPPMSSDFDVQTTQTADKGKVVVEALNKEGGAENFLSISGTVVGPDMKERKVRLVQTGPGVYEADFETKEPGNYVVALNYRGRENKNGILLGGLATTISPEMRDLKSNEAKLREIAERTNGRFMQPWTPPAGGLFSRDGLKQTASPLPVWDVLLPFLLGLIILDVAIRRIAWDWASTRRLAVGATDWVKSFTTTRQVETRQSVDALRKVREEVAETRFKPAAEKGAAAAAAATAARPDPKARFQAGPGVEGDLSSVVGGATDKPIPPPKKIEPKGGSAAAGGAMGGLMEAKRRAQQKIKEKEQGEG
jgi:uncharacterized membrane protein